MKTTILLCVLGLFAAVTWSCSNSTSTNSTNNEGFESPPYAKGKRVAVQADSLIGLAKQIPGFGGLFINQSGQLTIYLTQPEDQKAQARAVLSNSELVAGALSNTSASVSDMEVKKGQYTYVQLYEWRHTITGDVMAIEGVYSAGLDLSRNKLSFGVKNKAVREKVRVKLAELNIPEDAVFIYQMSEPEYLIGH